MFSSSSSTIVGVLYSILPRTDGFGEGPGDGFGDYFGEAVNFTTLPVDLINLSGSLIIYLSLFFNAGLCPPFWATLLNSPLGCLKLPTDESFSIVS